MDAVLQHGDDITLIALMVHGCVCCAAGAAASSSQHAVVHRPLRRLQTLEWDLAECPQSAATAEGSTAAQDINLASPAGAGEHSPSEPAVDLQLDHCGSMRSAPHQCVMMQFVPCKTDETMLQLA